MTQHSLARASRVRGCRHGCARRCSGASAAQHRAAAAVPDARSSSSTVRRCHNSRASAGGLALDALDPAKVDGHAETWEKVVRKLRTGMMPSGRRAEAAPAAARETFTARSRSRSSTRRPRGALDPGAPALHRLNRAEYGNAIRDLLALDVDVSALLPPDDSTAGFDNIADVLGVSPALIEGYVAAAAKISRLAVGDPSIGLDRVVYRVPGDLSQDAQVEGLPLGTRGGIVVRHTFPLDAEYDIQVGAGRWRRPARAERRRLPPRAADDRYVAIDGVRIDGAGARRARGSVSPPGLTPLLPRRRRPVLRQPAPTASSTSRRARRASRRSRLPARTTQRAR